MHDLQSRESSITSLLIDSNMDGLEWDVDTLVKDLSSHSSKQLVPNEESYYSIRDCVLLTRGCERSESSVLVETLQDLIRTCERSHEYEYEHSDSRASKQGRMR